MLFARRPQSVTRLLRIGSLFPVLVGVLTPLTGAGTPAAAAAPPVAEAEAMSLPASSGMVLSDPTASGQAELLVWSDSTARGWVWAGAATVGLVVRARGDQCDGAPVMDVAVDGVPAGGLPVPTATWSDYVVPGSWKAGRHAVAITFGNDHGAPGCDRNLHLDRLQLVRTGTAPTATPSPTVSPSPTASPSPTVSPSPTASPSPTVSPSPTASPSPTVSPGPTASPSPTQSPSPTASPSPTQSPSPTGGPVLSPGPTPSAGNPFAGAQPYRDPWSSAARAADARRQSDPAGAAALDRVAATASADWYGDWTPTSSLAAQVSGRVAAERAAGALPVLVAYDIPHRDCGSYSAGGAPDAEAYRRWVGQLAAGIGSARAVVVLEPDALPQMDCLSAADQAERTSLLAGAVSTLSALPATSVYLDAGGATWQPAAVMAERLRRAGVAGARGFSLNVSGFTATGVNLPYGDEVVRLLGGGHFLIDTSRNGAGAGDTWCNPVGRALGTTMTTATGDPLADAFTWVKAPGESDGTCGGGPSAGQFWAEYAIGLAQRAS